MANAYNVAALYNLGNTCYFNSVIQVLRLTPGFRQGLKDLCRTMCEKRIPGKAYGPEWNLISKLYLLFHSMGLLEQDTEDENDGEGIAIRPGEALESLRAVNDEFNNQNQHDAHELLLCVLHSIQLVSEQIVADILSSKTSPVQKLQSQTKQQLTQMKPCDKPGCTIRPARHQHTKPLSKPAFMCQNGPIHLPVKYKIVTYTSSTTADATDCVAMETDKVQSCQLGSQETESTASDGFDTDRPRLSDAGLTCTGGASSKNHCEKVSRRDSRLDQPPSLTLVQRSPSSNNREASQNSMKSPLGSPSTRSTSLVSPSGQQSPLFRSRRVDFTPPSPAVASSPNKRFTPSLDTCPEEDSISTQSVDFVSKHFQGNSVTVVHCCSCGESTQTNQAFLDVNVPLPGSVNCGGSNSSQRPNSPFVTRSRSSPRLTPSKSSPNLNTRYGGERFVSYQTGLPVATSPKPPHNVAQTAKATTTPGSVSPSDLSSDWLTQAFRGQEYLCNDNMYLCEKCDRFTEAKLWHEYVSLPPVLIVHLKRFETSAYGEISKLLLYNPTPLMLPCFQMKCQPNCVSSDHRYELYAVIVHQGYSTLRGHYVAYIRENAESLSTEMETKSISNKPLSNRNGSNDCSTKTTSEQPDASLEHKPLNARRFVRKLFPTNSEKLIKGGDICSTNEPLIKKPKCEENSTDLSPMKFDLSLIAMEHSYAQKLRSPPRRNVISKPALKANSLNNRPVSYQKSEKPAISQSSPQRKSQEPTVKRLLKKKEKNWLKFDDDTVLRLTEAEFVQILSIDSPSTGITPYLLFYTRNVMKDE